MSRYWTLRFQPASSNRTTSLLSNISITGARRRGQRVFYGWWVALAGAFNMVVSSGPTFQASSVLFRAIEDEFGWSRAAITGVASFGRFGGAMLGPMEGFLTDKFGSAKMVLLGFTMGGLGLIFFSRVQSIPVYYLSFFILSLGFSIGGFTPSMAAVNAWMPHRRATAMSLVLAGSSAGGLLVPAIVWGIQHHGWRDTVFVIGLITLAAGPVIARVLRKKLPDAAAMNRLVRRSTRKRKHTGQSGGLSHDFTPGEAIRTRAFWAISLTHTLTNFSVGTLSAHLYFHLTDDSGVGLGDALAGTIVAIQTVVAFSAQLAGGYIGDRVEKRFAVTGLALLQAIALAVLAISTNYWMAIAFALIWGVGFGGRTPILHAMRGDYFGRKHFGTILGMSAFPMAMGMTASPVVVGWVFEKQQTYEYVLLVLSGLALVASLTITLATRPKPPTGAGRRVKQPAQALKA
jgi:OFA family oxalate/formate antiporter-like MFS transporter